MTAFTEVAQGVYVLRHPVLDVNIGLVVGEGAALLVDTLSTAGQATELIDAVRRVTRARLSAVNTHHHFDHCFGNHTLAALGVPVWAHEEAARLLRERGSRLPREVYEAWLESEPDLAAGAAEVTVRPPDHTVAAHAVLDVGGRTVELRHLGRGHTAGDLMVLVPDARVLLTGDLIEEGGPPQFDDAYPLQWPETVAGLLALTTSATIVVPGHGRTVDRSFVTHQHAELAALAWLIRDGHGDGAPVKAVAARAPFDPATSTIAVRRGYAELSGSLD